MAKKAYIGVGGIARKVKKGYVGVNSIKYTLRNIAPTINGKTGFNAGSASTTHTKYASSSLMLTGTTSTPEVTAMSNATYPLVKDHKYYARVEIYQESVVGSSDFYWPVAEPSFYNGKVATAGKWKIINAVSTRSSWDSGSYNLRLDFNNNNNAGYMWFDGLMLIDLTEAFGEGNEPTATWMKKNVPFFTGTLDIEKKTTEGVARPIKKAYIGIGGVARPCWGGGELTYYGTITSMNAPNNSLAATTVGDYALFGGGVSGSNYSATVTAYDISLTRTTPTTLSSARSSLAATTVGDYALFGGGYTGSYSTVVNAYNTSLTRTRPTDLSSGTADLAATTVGNYALFGGGFISTGYNDSVYVYDKSLTKNVLSNTSYGARYLAATTIGNYALFGGGNRSGTSSVSVVYSYNSSLTKASATSLSTARMRLAATTVGNYALFGGGSTTTRSTYTSTVDAYDMSLTRTTPAALSKGRYFLSATAVGNYALFGGGFISSTTNVVDAYDSDLTRTTPTALSIDRQMLAATTVGNYALFGGGLSSTSSYSNAVDAYMIA